MSVAPAWAGTYVGVPYRDKGRTLAGADCWGLVRLALASHFGIRLPSYDGAYASANDAHSASRAVQRGLADGWQPCTAPIAGDLLILRIEGRPWHCALMVARHLFVHAPGFDRHGQPIDSMIEDVRDPMWLPRVRGYYRHKDLQHGC